MRCGLCFKDIPKEQFYDHMLIAHKIDMNKKQEKKSDSNFVEKNIVGEFLRIQDVLGFFKYDINPSYLDAKVEAEIAKQQRGLRQVPYQWIMILGFIIIIGVIAFVIVNGQIQGNTCFQQLLECKEGQSRIVTPTGITQTQSTGNVESGIGLK